MATVLTIPSLNLPTGSRDFGPVAAPGSLSVIALTLDVAQMTAGQVLWLTVGASLDGGETWGEAVADFDGPWLDKQGVLQNDVRLAMNYPVPPTHLRATLRVVNGPIRTGGGTLEIN